MAAAPDCAGGPGGTPRVRGPPCAWGGGGHRGVGDTGRSPRRREPSGRRPGWQQAFGTPAGCPVRSGAAGALPREAGWWGAGSLLQACGRRLDVFEKLSNSRASLQRGLGASCQGPRAWGTDGTRMVLSAGASSPSCRKALPLGAGNTGENSPAPRLWLKRSAGVPEHGLHLQARTQPVTLASNPSGPQLPKTQEPTPVHPQLTCPSFHEQLPSSQRLRGHRSKRGFKAKAWAQGRDARCRRSTRTGLSTTLGTLFASCSDFPRGLGTTTCKSKRTEAATAP